MSTGRAALALVALFVCTGIVEGYALDTTPAAPAPVANSRPWLDPNP